MTEWTLHGAVFDLDGVLTATAHLHAAAWESTFNTFLAAWNTGRATAVKLFDPEEDYLTLVDGKPRADGIRDFLSSRGITLPEGTAEDTEDAHTVGGLGNAKNRLFRELLDREGAGLISGSVRLLQELKKHGIKTAVASSSKNCSFILEATGLAPLFEVVIGGTAAGQIGLRGKPAPDIFITAADRLGIPPGQCLLIEDALSGVAAGRSGNFGLVIGVAGNASRLKLLAHGADIAVDDPAELTMDRILEWFAQGLPEACNRCSFTGFDAGTEKRRETLTATGNGYFVTRGALETEPAFDDVHYPGTYMAGIYNKTPSMIHGRSIWNNDLVNLPDWLLTEISIGGRPFRLHDAQLHNYQISLSFRDGMLFREIDFEDHDGRRSILRIKRFVSMAACHYGALQLELIPCNWSGPVTIDAVLDGTVTNNGVPRYRKLNREHLVFMDAGETARGFCLFTKTNYTNTPIYMHAATTLINGTEDCTESRSLLRSPGKIMHRYSVEAHRGQPLLLEKLVYITSGNSIDPVQPQLACFAAFDSSPTFTSLYDAHAEAWQQLWQRADIMVTGDRFVQRTTRLHIYHLLVTSGPPGFQTDTGLPARGLHGEAYRGHIFWDELFVLPFFTLHFPEITRARLLYRYRRLDRARALAASIGCSGALYPWQSADSGDEETQEIHFNPVSGQWDPDLSRNQRHVSIAVFYNIINYYRHTRDTAFITTYGAEMAIEIARGLTSLTTTDPDTGELHIRGVMGPDEFHEKYPGSDRAGIDDNAYTNIMTCWLLRQTLELIADLPAEQRTSLCSKLGWTRQEGEQWRKTAAGLRVEWSNEGILHQFAGYGDLNGLDLTACREKYGDIHRMDRILKAEGDSPDNYRIAKQADMLMLFYLLPPWDVADCLHYMGYSITGIEAFVRNHYRYYASRTTHGSTLSRVVHSSILKYLPEYYEEEYDNFLFAMESDIYDLQGGTTEEGIHTGVMGGTLDILISNFAGIMIRKNCITVNPRLPAHWQEVKLKLNCRGNLIELTVSPATVRIVFLDGPAETVRVQHRDDTRALPNGGETEFSHDNRGAFSMSR